MFRKLLLLFFIVTTVSSYADDPVIAKKIEKRTDTIADNVSKLDSLIKKVNPLADDMKKNSKIGNFEARKKAYILANGKMLILPPDEFAEEAENLNNVNEDESRKFGENCFSYGRFLAKVGAIVMVAGASANFAGSIAEVVYKSDESRKFSENCFSCGKFLGIVGASVMVAGATVNFTGESVNIVLDFF